MHRRFLALFGSIAIFLCMTAMAHATIYTTTIPEFTGTSNVPDPGPFPAPYLVGSFPVYYGWGSLDISGTFGNSTSSSTAGVDVFAGNADAGFYLIAQCYEYDACWTGVNGTTAWDTTLTVSYPAAFQDGIWDIYASQTSEYVVQLGPIAITENVVPEPSSFLMLGTGLVGLLGSMRRRFQH